jgi:hypothetical protein
MPACRQAGLKKFDGLRRVYVVHVVYVDDSESKTLMTL